jgi:hypothetical protein
MSTPTEPVASVLGELHYLDPTSTLLRPAVPRHSIEVRWFAFFH